MVILHNFNDMLFVIRDNKLELIFFSLIGNCEMLVEVCNYEKKLKLLPSFTSLFSVCVRQRPVNDEMGIANSEVPGLKPLGSTKVS